MTARAGATDPLRVRCQLPLAHFVLDVDLNMEARATGIWGGSGAGKSSLLELVAGLRRGASGQISFADEIWLDSRRALAPERRGIGYVPQDGLLFPHLNVRANLLAGARRRRAPVGAAPGLAEVAELLEIGALLERRVGSLSGGERQRVALGRALCSAPRLLLLDEPFGALDLPLRRRLLPILQRVFSFSRAPLLLVSHDPSEIVALCDEVVVLAKGRVVAQGLPRTLLTDPALHGGGIVGSYDNVLVGTIQSVADELCRVQVGADTHLVVRHRAQVNDEVVVSIWAHDIIVAREAPRGLSARNVLRGRITAMRGEARCWVTVASGEIELVVELSRTACEQLDLEVGREAYFLFKATSCRVQVHRAGGRGGNAHSLNQAADPDVTEDPRRADDPAQNNKRVVCCSKPTT